MNHVMANHMISLITSSTRTPGDHSRKENGIVTTANGTYVVIYDTGNQVMMMTVKHSVMTSS